MRRRKVLAGIGSLAAGGAAIISTGAFTQIDSEHDMSINVAPNSNSYLTIEAENTPNGSEYVDDSGDVVSLNFPRVNDRADSKFSYLLTIKNTGTQAVRVGADMDSSTLPSGLGIFAEGPPGDNSLEPRSHIQPNSSDPAPPGGNPHPYSYGSATGGGFDAWDDPVHLESGERVRGIGVAWDLNNVDSDSDNDLDDDLNGDWLIDIRAQDLDYEGA